MKTRKFDPYFVIYDFKEDNTRCDKCKGELEYQSLDQNDTYRGMTGHYCKNCKSSYAEPLKVKKSKKELREDFENLCIDAQKAFEEFISTAPELSDVEIQMAELTKKLEELKNK